MAKIKRKHVDALLAKAMGVFSKQRYVLTGYGLSRSELRKLARMGIVEKRLTRTDRGNYLWMWGMVRVPPHLAQQLPDAAPDRPWPTLKPGVIYRLARKEKKDEADKV